MAIEPRCSRERMAGAGRWTPGPARHLVLALMAALLTIAACAHPQSLNVPKAAASSAAMTSASYVYDPTALDAPEDIRGQAATARGGSRADVAGQLLGSLTTNVIAANAGDDLTRVGRWMSQSEYDQMVKSSRVIEGGGGRTYVVRPPNPETYKPGKGVYAEFDVPRSSLHPAGGNPNYAVIPGPNAGTTRFGPLPTQMPRATCIELVCRR